MPRVDVTAKAGCIYDSVPRSVGEVFNCDLGHARMLRLIGKVEYEEPPAPVKVDPKRLKSDGSFDRRYRRRDMTAEG